MLFIIAFNFQHNPPSGWYQQFMPDLMGGAQIRDITFTDSMNGYIVTNIVGSNSYILKTTDAGNNWSVKFAHNQPFVRVIFIDNFTGFTNAFTKIFKTTDSGENWSEINLPQIYGDDMFVLNEDTIWLAMSEFLTGGVFRTTNGGISWQQQYSAGSNNPNKIYFYDANIGFINAGGNLYRTSNGGENWTQIPSFGGGFYDIIFIDSLTGWKTTLNTSVISKTTDGGLNWFLQGLPPQSGFFAYSVIGKFALINKDTVWGGYPFANFNNQYIKGILYITSDGGENWNYQVPELTTMGNVPSYRHLYFINKDIGWAYHLNAKGVHTVTGGDTIFLSIEQISSEIPSDFNLYQNYPNPFNPTTKIRFDISNSEEVKLVVHDILGRVISVLVNERLSPGIYEYTFEAGSDLSSGVYFYTLQTGKASVTKRMVFNK